MRFKRTVSAVIVAVMTLGLFSGCAKSKEDTIKIGVLAPLTGELSIYGKPTHNGIKLAIDEINAKGGILGKQIEMIDADEKGDIAEATNAYRRIRDKGIVALIGDVTSGTSTAVAELAAEDGMPMITPTGTAASITQKGDNVFRVCFTDPFQGEVMAKFVADNLKLKKVAILSNTSDDYSKGIAKSFKDAAKAKGIEIVAEEGYGANDKDFNTQLIKIQSKSPEAIIVPDYTDKVALIAPQARTAGFTGVFLGGDGWDGVFETLGAANAKAVDNSYFTNHFSPTDTASIVANFAKNYKAKYDKAPASFAALGYDAVYLVAKAIENANSTDSAKIVKALSAISLDCVTGKITFDKGGDPVKEVSIIKLQDGKSALFTKVAVD